MLAMEQWGEGPDLVLIHGWGLNGAIWSDFAAPLARRFRVHLVDLPGHGASPLVEPYTLEGLVSACAQSLPPRVHLCGWSLGAQVALRYALRYPQRVDRLVLISATPRFVKGSDWEHGVDPATLEAFAAELTRDYHATLRRFLALQARGGEEARQVIKSLSRRLFARGAPQLAALKGGLAILRETDLRGEVAGLVSPTLVIHGERDTLTLPAAGRWLAGRLPQGRWRAIPGAAHAPFLSHGQGVQLTMEAFLGE
ncbi:MAG: pimeloyl-ACP methyl ester esterase BioH [Burkholderiales bacterium]|nr:pimeloyl-ACP methyl ester esterase BioH [Burkholderiales bacterium]